MFIKNLRNMTRLGNNVKVKDKQTIAMELNILPAIPGIRLQFQIFFPVLFWVSAYGCTGLDLGFLRSMIGAIDQDTWHSDSHFFCEVCIDFTHEMQANKVLRWFDFNSSLNSFGFCTKRGQVPRSFPAQAQMSYWAAWEGIVRAFDIIDIICMWHVQVYVSWVEIICRWYLLISCHICSRSCSAPKAPISAKRFLSILTLQWVMSRRSRTAQSWANTFKLWAFGYFSCLWRSASQNHVGLPSAGFPSLLGSVGGARNKCCGWLELQRLVFGTLLVGE